jgi:putative DNA primase/helicase
MAQKKAAPPDGQNNQQDNFNTDPSDCLDPQVQPNGKRIETKIAATPEIIQRIVRDLPSTLSPNHVDILRNESSVSPEIIALRGYRSILADRLSVLKMLGFSEKHGPGLLIPVRDLDGEIVSAQVRFDRPVIHEDGKTGKRKKLRYLSPPGMDLRVDFPAQPLATDESLWIVEGVKKADSLRSRGVYAISILGVWGALGKQARKDLSTIDWTDREIIVCFDSDIASNPNVQKAETATTKLFRELGASVQVVRLPESPDGAKTGVDDFFAGGGTLEQLYDMIQPPEPDWKGQLVWSETTGALKVNSANLALILQNDERFKDIGNVAYDEFANILFLNQKPLTDHVLTEIGAEIELAWKTSAIHPGLLLGVLAMLGHRNAFHPVRDWLLSLTWDKIPRVDSLFSAYFGATASEYSRAVSRCFLIGAVARIMSPGCKVDLVPILQGPQGCGKSTGIMTLFCETWTGVPSTGFDSKDFLQFVHSGVWCVELAELSSLRKSEVESVKSLISSQVDKFRPPYGRTPESFPRQCVLVGTTNSDTFLKDHTGNRRFLPVKVGKIDASLIRADRDQIFAEALSRYQAGESWHAIPWDEAEFERDCVFEADAWEERLGPWLSAKFPKEAIVSEILEDCFGVTLDRQSRADQTRVGAMLRRFGWISRQVRSGDARIRVYSPAQPNVVPEVVTRCDNGSGAGLEQPSQPKIPATSIGLNEIDNVDSDDEMKSVYRTIWENGCVGEKGCDNDLPVEDIDL